MSDIPPWSQSEPQICLTKAVCLFFKYFTDPVIYKQAFLEITSKHENCVQILPTAPKSMSRLLLQQCHLLLQIVSSHAAVGYSSHLIYPLTARVVGAQQMISQPVSSIYPVLHCPRELAGLQACPFPDVVFPLLPLSALSSSRCYCALEDGFGQT